VIEKKASLDKFCLTTNTIDLPLPCYIITCDVISVLVGVGFLFVFIGIELFSSFKPQNHILIYLLKFIIYVKTRNSSQCGDWKWRVDLAKFSVDSPPSRKGQLRHL